MRVTPQGAVSVELADSDEGRVVRAEAAFAAGRMQMENEADGGAACLGGLSCLAFGGAELRTAYLGTLSGCRIASLPLAVAGRPPPHWTYPQGQAA